MKQAFNGLWLALGAALMAAPGAAAAAYPDKPIRLIVPAAAGGTTDIASRLVGKRMGELLGQPVVVENRAGGGGIIGAQALRQSAADGYTLMMGNIGPNAINYSLYRQLPYRAEDFAPITLVVSVPNVLVVNASVPARTVAELVALARAQPGKYSFASSGTGQSVHLSGELFRKRTGTDLIHVPYKGAAPAVADLVAGQVTMMVDNLPSSLPHIRSGKLRALAVTSASRVPELPDVPTMKEAGVNDFQVTAWFGLVAPAGTPPEVIDRLQKTVAGILDEPEIKSRLAELGGIPGGDTPAHFGSFIKSERERWARVVKDTGIAQQ
ncbi:Bug family tripartite tricarboxylate transporter substrate binding protein [Cupriavidus alkaliphilus]|uniref:Tripartite-type tricarboxylate transporter receptor subunit TctC n=1 Tax=Cupriavidus alkaliphilus TaxID=942866 RepID=A0A7W4VCF8_9BURK|nr:tripartite-type tricarboxylate transporter receptor subunit TctC [Cupriavidus alkaliphilus]PVY79482.1 tripartite-type tricarboxylate transporter receptor subunit TctC [Cupriavidus alkaliphilus]SCB22971.1 Tripartite-type tricarboxylate transporter, receptor component TctC [Cupriavidus alkaliphilus]